MQMTIEKELKTYNVLLLIIRLYNSICTGQSQDQTFFPYYTGSRQHKSLTWVKSIKISFPHRYRRLDNCQWLPVSGLHTYRTLCIRPHHYKPPFQYLRFLIIYAPPELFVPCFLYYFKQTKNNKILLPE